MKKIFKLSIIVTLLIFCISCSKDWIDINDNPNAILSAPDSLVFPSGVASVATVIGGQYAIMGGIWSQYITQNSTANQYKDLDAFQLTTTTMDDQWDELYAGALKDFKYVREEAQKEKNWHLFFMSTVMEAYTYQILVDLYDQIPFNEALQGPGIMTPHYDNGQLVYDSIVARIDRAKKLDFDAKTSKNPGKEDLLFNGDINLWLQFANTVKLKIFLRQCYARPDVASAGIANMVNDPYFKGFLTTFEVPITATTVAMTQYVDDNLKDNPLYEENIRTLNFTRNLVMSYTMYSWLVNNNDTVRLTALYSQGDQGTGYNYLVQGDFTNTPPGFDAKYYAYLAESPSDPVYFLTAAESNFLQAEAIIRGYMAGSAKDAYDQGVLAAYDQLHRDGSAYIAPGGPYAFNDTGTFEQQLEQIIVQKWASMAGQHGLEAYIEHTRTHYPKESLVAATDVSYIPGQWTMPVNASTKAYPKRLLFTDHERSYNKNTPAFVPFITPVWWDKNSSK